MKRKLKYNLSSTVFIVVIIALIVFFNVVTSSVFAKFPVKFDFSRNKLYTLSEETLNVLSTLDSDVNVYYISSQPADGILQVLDMYKMHSRHINAETHDPVNDPMFLKNIQAKGFEPAQNDIIVECGNRMRLIPSQSMYETKEDQTTGSSYTSSLVVEQQLTTAISYVAGDKDLKVAFSTGHGEQNFDTLSAILTSENITAEKINLKTQDIAADCLTLFVMGPTSDFSEAEITKLFDFVSRGGSLAVCLDYKTEKLPALQQYLLQHWGVNFNNDIIAEQSSGNTVGKPFVFYAMAEEHDITTAVSSAVLWSNSQSISTEYSYGVVQNVISKTTETGISMHADGTIVTEGNIPLSAVLEKTNSDGTRSRMFVSGSHTIFNSAFLNESSLGNRDFLYATVKYLNRDEGSALSIAPKSLMVTSLAISDSLVTVYIILFAVLPSLIILLTGLIVWIRRRHL